MLGTWPCPVGVSGGTIDELALIFDHDRARRVLVLPALFDEANKLRHFTAEVMREMDRRGMDCFLPDLAGCNESEAPLQAQGIVGWRKQAAAAATHFRANEILAIRGGGLLDPGTLPGVRYAAIDGASLLRGMLRARVLADREAGLASEREALLEHGRSEGLTLAGYRLGASMIGELSAATPPVSRATDLPHSVIGGAALWLRAEPAHDSAQAMKLAALVDGGAD